MHAHRLTKSVPLQIFYHAIYNSGEFVCYEGGGELVWRSQTRGEYQGAVTAIVQEYPKYT